MQAKSEKFQAKLIGKRIYDKDGKFDKNGNWV